MFGDWAVCPKARIEVVRPAQRASRKEGIPLVPAGSRWSTLGERTVDGDATGRTAGALRVSSSDAHSRGAPAATLRKSNVIIMITTLNDGG